jgi:signal transduction histidine kinase
MFFFTYISILASLVSLLSFYWLLRKGDNLNARNIALLFFTLFLWTLSNAAADLSTEAKSLLIWSNLALIAGFWLSSLTVIFGDQYDNLVYIKSRVTISITVLSAIITALLIFGVGGYSEPVITPGSIPSVSPGFFAYLLTPYYLFSLVTTYFYLNTVRKNSSLIKKKQINNVIIGLYSLAFGGLLFSIVLPAFGYIQFYTIGPVFSLLPIAFIGYAILKYGFLDIKLIIQRGFIYTLVFALVAMIYALILAITGVLIGNENVSVVTAGFLTSILGISSVPKIDSYLRKKTDKFFFKGKYEYAKVLSELSNVLNKNHSEKTITKKAGDILTVALKSSFVSFNFDTDAPSSVLGLALPIKSASKRIGFIHLGEKKSGLPYTDEDISLVSTFASQAGVALEKARLFAEVKDYARTLEKRVAERTAEIVELQKEQESMMHEISHGLQTPLTIMKGELFFLRKQGYETGKIDTIDSSINRISYFINKLLALYRLETAPKTVRRKVGLKVMLESILLSFSESLNENNFFYELKAEKEVVVMGDGDAIEEVVSNLVNNAIKYSKKGESNKLSLLLTSDKKSAHIKVSDSGIGVSEEHLSKLFTKFYRVKSDQAKHVSGTGLGLVICKKIIEQHG